MDQYPSLNIPVRILALNDVNETITLEDSSALKILNYVMFILPPRERYCF